jgi:hypothetical protein
MLLDHHYQLLTAYVDGELTSHQRRQVDRLLECSVEARRLLQQLQRDAQALRNLPVPSFPEDLSERVLYSIREQRLVPGRSRTAKLAAASPWMGTIASFAAAASLLLILGAASYLYFAVSSTNPTKSETARNEEGSRTPISPPDRAPFPPVGEEPPRKVPHEAEQPEERSKPTSVVQPPAIVKNNDEGTKRNPTEKSNPIPKEETTLTERLEMFQLDRAADTLPVVIKVRELTQATKRQSFLDELRKDSSFRIEFPCKHGTKAFERVRNAAQTIRLGLIVEKQAQERIKMKWHTNYVLYVENVTPEELTRFLHQVGEEDLKLSAGKTAEEHIDRLVLTRMTDKQRKELSTLLGIDPITSIPSSKGPLGTDPSKPLSDQTAQQLGLALAGQGIPRPGTGNATVKPPERFALVLAYNPVRPAPGSKEIKLFLDSRKPARPGALHVLLVLRSS